MSPARSQSLEVRNPLLALPAMAELAALPIGTREPLARLLEELAQDAHGRAERSWAQRKGPMAAYWRAVGVYARHAGRAIVPPAERRARVREIGASTPLPLETHRKDGSCHPNLGLGHLLVAR